MAGRGQRGRFASAASLACLLALQDTASAAVRLCGEAVSSGPVKGASEQAAKTDALAAWKKEATRQGEGYSAWRLATGKLLQCLPGKDGGFECLASARPCTIEQAPDRRDNRKNRIGI